MPSAEVPHGVTGRLEDKSRTKCKAPSKLHASSVGWCVLLSRAHDQQSERDLTTCPFHFFAQLPLAGSATVYHGGTVLQQPTGRLTRKCVFECLVLYCTPLEIPRGVLSNFTDTPPRALTRSDILPQPAKTSRQSSPLLKVWKEHSHFFACFCTTDRMQSNVDCVQLSVTRVWHQLAGEVFDPWGDASSCRCRCIH